MVNFMTQPPYFWCKNQWLPLARRLGGPQNGSGRGGEEKSRYCPSRGWTQRYVGIIQCLFLKVQQLLRAN